MQQTCCIYFHSRVTALMNILENQLIVEMSMKNHHTSLISHSEHCSYGFNYEKNCQNEQTDQVTDSASL